MKLLKVFRKKYMTSNFSLMIYAFFIAVLIWLFISVTQYPSVQKTIEGIPLSLDISGSAASQNGLSIIDCDIDKVTIVLSGSRTKIAYLSNETLEAYVDADKVTTAGTKNMSVKIRSTNGIEYKVESVTPSSASVIFDKIDTREFPVIPLTPNVSVVDGMEINTKECSPDAIRITGPSAKLDKIARVCSFSDKVLSLDSNYVLGAEEIRLYTEDNALIDQSQLKFSDQNFSINISLRSTKTVILKPNIVNIPDRFDLDTVKLKLSAEKVTLACSSSQTEIPDVLEFGSISLNELKPGFSQTFSIKNLLADTDLINVSDLETITVEFDPEGLATKDMTLDRSRIKITNIPDSSYNYEVVTQSLDITLVGPEDVLADISSEDIVATVSLLNTQFSGDQVTNTITFSCPEYNNVWVASSTKVSVLRTKDEAPTTANNAR